MTDAELRQIANIVSLDLLRSDLTISIMYGQVLDRIHAATDTAVDEAMHDVTAEEIRRALESVRV